ncbi:MAG TPA: SIMPL domain-containing protein [Bryobacteraceae bacterium]|jgi:hypothetical protein|nr:SIMPL domain-containing protein [Bryobacteraceae bacterium]
MATKKNERAGDTSSTRREVELKPDPVHRQSGVEEPLSEKIARKDTEPMASYASQGHTQPGSAKPVEGVTVTGEAVRRVSPEHAEFLIEIVASAPTAAQALRDNQTKFTQVAQALQALGVHAADLQTISQNVVNLYTPVMQALPAYGMPQIGQAGYGAPTDLQFGSCHSRNIVRVNVRDSNRAGEILDAATRAGAIIAGVFSFKASDEAGARRATLEAAGKDARAKAETLAAAAGKQIGDPISISEELIASNGTYTALRSALPFTFGAGTPQATGELEYYARVSASFRLQ